jgi:hypothetical protein
MFWGDNALPKIIIGAVGGIFGSWAIGAFFMMPLLIPAQISGVEEKVTGKNHSAMYFAVQALISSIVSAISGALVYENIKMLYVSKKFDKVVSAVIPDGKNEIDFAATAERLGVNSGEIFNFGLILIPFIVSAVCIIGIIISSRWPKNFSHKEVAKALKEQDPTLDISDILAEPDEFVAEEKGETIFVQIGLSILSGFIFGFIWLAFLLKSIKEIIGKGKSTLMWALASFVPFAGAFVAVKMHNELKAKADELGVKLMGNKAVLIILSVLFPILPINVIALSIIQRNVNAIYNAE